MQDLKHARAVLELYRTGASMVQIARLLNLTIEQVANIIAQYSK